VSSLAAVKGARSPLAAVLLCLKLRPRGEERNQWAAVLLYVLREEERNQWAAVLLCLKLRPREEERNQWAAVLLYVLRAEKRNQ